MFDGGTDSEADSDTESAAPRCSAKGCRVAATVELQWRNPRLHDTSRTKRWLACDEHEQFLADFLARRDFLLDRARL